MCVRARVACVCMRAMLCQDADGRECQATAVCEASREAPWTCARRLLGASLERGEGGRATLPLKMATTHSTIGLDMTALPRTGSTTGLGSGFTPFRVTRECIGTELMCYRETIVYVIEKQ